MDMSWLAKIAPTVAAALGGPLAGIAVSALGSALGLSEPTKQAVTEALQSGNLTGEQIAAIKLAEIQLKQRESDNGFKFAELATRDMESARNREIAVKDKTPAVLAGLAVVSGAIIGSLVLAGMTPALKDPALAATAGTVVGFVFNEIKQVYSYYFGTSASSGRKDATIANLSQP